MPLMLAVITLFAMLMVEDVDADQTVNQKKTEPTEITIYISGQHKAMVAALLDAVDEGTPVTGIADFDSLSSTYGLMGVYRKGSRSSGFYGHRFRLTFPPAADVVAIAGAYWNLPYVQSVEPEPPPEARARKAGYQKNSPDRAVMRIPKKVGVGVLTTVGVGLVLVPGAGTEGDDGIGAAVAGSASFFFGYPLGVYLADRKESSFWLTFIGSGLGWWGAAKLLDSPNSSELSEWGAWVTLLGAPVLASELSRMDAVTGGPKQSQDIRFSVGLVPQIQRGLSAVATLRF